MRQPLQDQHHIRCVECPETGNTPTGLISHRPHVSGAGQYPSSTEHQLEGLDAEVSGRFGARDHTRSGTNPVTNFRRSTRLYLQNRGLDRDKDGIACEKL